MNSLYQYPSATEFGKIVSKRKIYEHGNVTNKVKELFVSQLQSMNWSHKLSPQTINLPASEGVQEIQVFKLHLKTAALSDHILSTIDKAIPSPIIYHLIYQNKQRTVACYKRPSEADSAKWVVSAYFKSPWSDLNLGQDQAQKQGMQALPVVLNLGALYQHLLQTLIALAARQNETLAELVKRAETLNAKQREADALKTKINQQKQFNRRVELNRQYTALQAQITALTT